MVVDTDLQHLLERLGTTSFEDDHAVEYLKEAIDCLKHDHFRAATVLFWSILMYVAYRRIEQYGLDDFVRFAVSKGLKPSGNVNSVYDLNKIKDADMIRLCHEIGLYDQSIRKRLAYLLDTRNSFAHISQATTNRYSLIGFVNEVCDYCAVIRNSAKKVEPSFIQKIKKLKDDELRSFIKQLPFGKVEGAFLPILDRVDAITTDKENRESKSLYDFVIIALEVTEEESERIKLFDIVFGRMLRTDDVIKYDFYFGDKIAELAGFSYIREHIVKSGRLDGLIKIFGRSWSFQNAKANATAIEAFNATLSKEQVNTIAHLTAENNQIYESYGARSRLHEVFHQHKHELSQESIRLLKSADITNL